MQLRGLPLDELMSDAQIDEFFFEGDQSHEWQRAQGARGHQSVELTFFTFLGLIVIVISITVTTVMPTLWLR